MTTSHQQFTETSPTREGWLHRAIEIYRARFTEVGYELPEKIHVSVGFSFGSKQESLHTRGCCWARAASVDEVNHIFISPALADTAQVLLTLLHECIHAALDCEDGHRKRFAEIATRFGFEGSMTSSQAGLDLGLELITLAETLGEYPHGQLRVGTPVPVTPGVPVPVGGGGGAWITSAGKAQRNRYHKVICPADGYTVRIAQKWIDAGLPSCGICGHELQLG